MRGYLLILSALVVIGIAFAIPSSLLSDVKQMEMAHSRMSNKVKRAQEVIMFGNQQNRAADGRNYALPRAEKRGGDVEDNMLNDAVTEQPLSLGGSGAMYPADPDNNLEEPKAMAQYDKAYREAAAAEAYPDRMLKSQLYTTDPAALNEFRYYDMDERRKRNAVRTARSPVKRSVYSRAALTSSRAKRDLDIEPEELLTLLTLWEAERRNKFRDPRTNWGRYTAMDADEYDPMEGPADDSNEIDDDEAPRNGGWLEGPVVPNHHYTAGGDSQWGRQRFSEDRRKRFMVSKRRPQDNDMYSLAQMLNNPRHDSYYPHRLSL